MEERKKLAKEIDGKFFIKRLELFGIHMLFVLCIVLAGVLQSSVLSFIGVFGFWGFFALSVNISNRYYYANRMMTSRALIGKEISADPVKEGLDRIKEYGWSAFRDSNMSINRILHASASNAMAVGSIVEAIPGLGFVASIYKSMVEKAYKDTSRLIVGYELGCYEKGEPDHHYDLVTYFIQDGKNFLVRTLKSELKSRFITAFFVILTFISMIICFFTKSLLFGFVTIGVFVLYFVVGIMTSSKDDFNTFCEYVNFVQTHELNTELRNQIAGMSSAETSIHNIRNAVANPHSVSVKAAANGVDNLMNMFK